MDAARRAEDERDGGVRGGRYVAGGISSKLGPSAVSGGGGCDEGGGGSAVAAATRARMWGERDGFVLVGRRWLAKGGHSI